MRRICFFLLFYLIFTAILSYGGKQKLDRKILPKNVFYHRMTLRNQAIFLNFNFTILSLPPAFRHVETSQKIVRHLERM